MFTQHDKIIKIFTLEQQFPCGPRSSCCGPIGQSKEEISSLKAAIEKLGHKVEVHSVQKMKNLQEEHPQVFKLIRTFGFQAVPIISIDNDIACMGTAKIDEIVTAVKNKL